MISKKFMQSNLIANNNKIISRIFTNKIINLSSSNFASQLNLNYSHMPNALPLEGLNIKSKKNSNAKVNLNQMFLSKLSINFNKQCQFPMILSSLSI